MLKKLKENLMEEKYPFFSDDELERIYTECGGDITDATYKALIIKAECDGLRLPDMTLDSSRRYWLSLASLYRRSRTGMVIRGDGR